MKNEEQAEAAELCPNCGTAMEGEGEAAICPKCATEIDWGLEDESDG